MTVTDFTAYMTASSLAPFAFSDVYCEDPPFGLTRAAR